MRRSDGPRDLSLFEVWKEDSSPRLVHSLRSLTTSSATAIPAALRRSSTVSVVRAL